MADRRGSVLIALWSLAVLTLVGCTEDDPVSTEVLRAELICDSTITVTDESRSEEGIGGFSTPLRYLRPTPDTNSEESTQSLDCSSPRWACSYGPVRSPRSL